MSASDPSARSIFRLHAPEQQAGVFPSVSRNFSTEPDVVFQQILFLAERGIVEPSSLAEPDIVLLCQDYLRMRQAEPEDGTARVKPLPDRADFKVPMRFRGWLLLALGIGSWTILLKGCSSF